MSSKPKLIPGRYTKGSHVGEVRYLDPRTGRLYADADGMQVANSRFTHEGGGVWTAHYGWEFTEDAPHATKPEPYGYLVCSPNGPGKVLHLTAAEAEVEAMRLAKANIGMEFIITPVHLATPVAKVYTPKPKPTLERL